MANSYAPLENFGQLKADVESYINRNDQETINMIPLFINSAEKSIYRQLRMPSIERFIQITVKEEQAASGYVDIPFDYLEMRHIWAESSTGKRPLQRKDYSELLLNTESCGFPVYFARVANRFYFHPKPTTDVVLKMVYWRDTTELSDANPTNPVLTIAHDVLLFKTLSEAYGWLMEEEKEQYWNNKASRRLQEIQQMVYESEFSGSTLFVSNTTDMEGDAAYA